MVVMGFMACWVSLLAVTVGVLMMVMLIALRAKVFVFFRRIVRQTRKLATTSHCLAVHHDLISIMLHSHLAVSSDPFTSTSVALSVFTDSNAHFAERSLVVR